MIVPLPMFVTLRGFVKLRVSLPPLMAIASAILAVQALPARAVPEGLAGTAWRLVQYQDGAGRILEPDDQSDYTVEFKTDSTVAMHLDCHRGRGTWVSRSASQLELGPIAFTRADCPRTPLYDQITRQWASVRSYVLRDKHLFLSLTAGGGSYELEPENVAAAQSQGVASTQGVAPGRVAGHPHAQEPSKAARSPPPSWLEDARPLSWNKPGAMIPTAPHIEGPVEARCRSLARAPELEADRQLTGLGWDLIGAYQGGWGILVIQGAAGYDGMCRPRAYQEFVFVRGVFAGTLSPLPMDSRSDGALNRVILQDGRRLIADYARYTPNDALCCPSRTASVVFELEPDSTPRPVSVTASSNSGQ
jgi:LppP/LprE lipoprotein/META domain-containing protein